MRIVGEFHLKIINFLLIRVTGAGRKHFEFTEMDEILDRKKKINPTLTLSTSTINMPNKKENLEQIQSTSLSEPEGQGTSIPN